MWLILYKTNGFNYTKKYIYQLNIHIHMVEKLVKLVTRKLATACRQIPRADSVEVLPPGNIIKMTTLDLDTLHIVISMDNTLIGIGKVRNIKPTITRDDAMYIAYRGFEGSNVAATKDAEAFIKQGKLDKSHYIIQPGVGGVVLYKKGKLQ